MTLRAILLTCLVGCGAAGDPEPTPSQQEAQAEVAEPAASGEVRCIAYTNCGCWSGCVRVRDVEEDVVEVLDGELAGTNLRRREDCYDGRCFLACNPGEPDVPCEAGAYEASQTCTGSCAPSQAPYRCTVVEGECRQIDHPY
jgi:hypothetical protein